MKEINQKIFVAVDGSDESREVVRYVSEAVQPGKADILLYHVMTKVPEVFWDLGNDPEWLPKIEAVKTYAKKQEDFAVKFINAAVDTFKNGGFGPASVTTRIGTKREGIARDIVAEAKQGGFDVLVVGRGKIGEGFDMPLGGVASKILGTNAAPVLWLVGGKPSSEKILVAMDSSEHSMQAVKHAGRLFNHGSNSFTLFYAIRGITVSTEGMEDIFPAEYCKRLLEDAEREIRPSLQMAEDVLGNLGIGPDRISTKIVTGVKSRAAAVVDEAKKGGYGTIVVGRRGNTEVREFSMGRVTNKLTQLAKDQSLCIVG